MELNNSDAMMDFNDYCVALIPGQELLRLFGFSNPLSQDGLTYDKTLIMLYLL